MNQNYLRQYFDKLDKKDEFIDLLEKFIDKSISEQYISEINEKKDTISYSKFYERFIKSVFVSNAETIFKHCESPIERQFLNSFMLLFIKNRMPCLFVTQPFKDVESEVTNFRNHYNNVDKFINSYKEATNDRELIYFNEKLINKQNNGELTKDEVDDILAYHYLRKVFEFNSYHITPQAFFPQFKIENKAIRADFYVWVPNDPSVKIIIECDGFKFHNSKTSFTNDRKRDRLFQLNGYKVVRYSGSEIYKDPIQVSKDLYDLLDALDEDKEKNRMT